MGRLRHDNTAKDYLLTKSKYFLDLEKSKSKINNHFKNNKKLFIEIGMGKGDFIIKNSMAHSDINYVGIEKFETVIAKASKKIEEQEIKNLIFTSMDAKDINTYFDNNSVDHLFLNFSDPWPKKKHEPRRLVHPIFLNKYFDLLKENSLIEFKTDNDKLFNWFVEEIVNQNKNNFEVKFLTTDLYKELEKNPNMENFATEYETRFVNLNKNINKISFIYRKKIKINK